jgi:murein endopeptidase
MHEFSNLKGMSELARTMVETKKHRVHPQMYLLLKLALILSVATASVEKVFSAMNYIKNDLKNKLCDQWMNDCLVTYIERDS